MKTETEQDFVDAANTGGGNVFAEYWAFLCHNKKWWLLPILVCFVLFGLFLLLSSTAAAPFIYTLF